MKIPAPMMPPITAIVVPNRPRWRASPAPAEARSLEFSGGFTILGSRGLDWGSSRLRQFVEVLHVGEGCAVHALYFRVFRFDEVILIWGMRAAAVAQAEMPGRQTQRITGEDVAWPGAGEARQNHGIDAVLFVHSRSGANDSGIGRR